MQTTKNSYVNDENGYINDKYGNANCNTGQAHNIKDDIMIKVLHARITIDVDKKSLSLTPSAYMALPPIHCITKSIRFPNEVTATQYFSGTTMKMYWHKEKTGTM